jgi:uncharacterized protein (TIGR02266 family)
LSEERRRERRLRTKIPVKLAESFDVDVASEHTFLFAYITDISALGIFVATASPPPVGTSLRLRFEVPEGLRDDEGLDEAFELVGEVVWVADDERAPSRGMGLRFAELDDDARGRLMRLVRAIAFLDASDAN